jgi:hypothetical protein
MFNISFHEIFITSVHITFDIMLLSCALFQSVNL